MSSQLEFTYDPVSLETLIKYISLDRLATYFVMAKGNPVGAIRLYERNTELSEALYGVIQGLEVTSRNAVHNTLTATHGPAWYEKINLQESEGLALSDAKRNIANRGEEVTSGRIVAELNFGFWVRLFSAGYDRTLWGPSFRRILPMKLDRRMVYERLKDVKTLRNRIAHHIRIIGRKKPVAEHYREVIETIGWFSPTMRI